MLRISICSLWPLCVLAAQPHIIYFLIDDMGWNDVSYHNSTIPTPNIDDLAHNGLRLEQHYVQQICSPTRAALISGRYPYTTGVSHGLIANGHKMALPLSAPSVAEFMKKAGYNTHGYGKWDVGGHKWAFTPLGRGFDTFFGFFNAAADYYKHTDTITWTENGTKQHCEGLDLCCTPDKQPIRDQAGNYSTHMYSAEVLRTLKSHTSKDPPLFLYVAYQAVHGPLQAPQEYIDRCAHLPLSADRHTFCGMSIALDEGIGNITLYLKQSGMWQDTLIVFSTDNGGPNQDGANNWPLRGNKATVWEGGVRGVSFISGGYLPQSLKSTQSNVLMHVTDWLPTLVQGVAGYSVQGTALDGYNMWPTLTTGAPSPRKEVLLRLDPARGHYQGDAALRRDQWKLIVGHQNSNECFSGWWMENGTCVPAPSHSSSPYYLFDIVKDPLETTDLSLERMDVVTQLLARIESYNASHVPQQGWDNPMHPESCPKKNGGAWMPWMDAEDGAPNAPMDVVV